MSESVLKKVVIESYSGFFSRPHYEDKFVITNNSVNYKKEYSGPFRFNEDGSPQQFENIQWSYKTKNEFKWFESLRMDLELLEQEEQHVLDAGGYSLDIFYEDGTKKSFHFFDVGDVKNETLQHIFYLLRQVVPPNEEIPNYMQISYDTDYYLLKEILKTLEKGETYNGQSLKEDFLLKLVEFDFEYVKNIERIENEKKQIENFSFDEIRTFITYMARDERWSSGAFEEYVKDGTALRVAKRLKELTYEDDEEEVEDD